MSKLLLIDSDILRYSHGSIETKHPFLEGEFIPASSEQITRLVDDVIAKSCKACGTTDYICVLSGKGNFREEVAKQAEYKGNRDPSKSRPYHFDTVGNHIIENHPHVVIDGHEADDYMGYIQYNDWKTSFKDSGFNINPDNLKTIIGSRDKDLRTVQGWHYSWECGAKQPEKPLYYISPSKGMYQFFYQMLIGDNTDNIMGCGVKKMVPWGKEINEKGEEVPRMMLRRKGVGDKAAHKILQSCLTVRDMVQEVAQQYGEVFGHEEYDEVMLENARLLFIGQTQDNLFEWSWLSKYYDLPNEQYVDPASIVKRTRKRKLRTEEQPTTSNISDEGCVSSSSDTPIPRFGNDNSLQN